MRNLHGLRYNTHGSRTRPSSKRQRNHRRLRLHLPMGHHQTCSQRQIPSATIPNDLHVDLISQVFAGFGLKDVSIPEIMKRNKIPVLFIHGDADNYVPMWMTIKNYEACAAPKELYIVPGAGHALAFSKDMEEGKRRIKNFIEKYSS